MKLFNLYKYISIIEFIISIAYIGILNSHTYYMYIWFGTSLANLVLLGLILIWQDINKLTQEADNKPIIVNNNIDFIDLVS